MSRDQGRTLLAIGLLLIAAVAMVVFTQGEWARTSVGAGNEYVADIDNWQRTDRERVVSSPYQFSLKNDLAELPLAIGEWTGEDIPQTNLEVFILLEPEQYVQRVYRLADRRYVWLSLIGSRKSKSFHSPQICYDTDGWQTRSSSVAVPLDDGEIYALQLYAQKTLGQGGAVEHVVLYFYLWPSTARESQDGLVLLKVTAPLYGTVEETVALQQAFIAELFHAGRP